MQRSYEYHDELNDDFAGINRNEKVIPDDYVYRKDTWIYRLLEFLFYRIIMTPVAFIYCKCKFHYRIENRKVLKAAAREGCFLFGNHTQVPGDGYLAALVPFPKKIGVLVNPDSVAVKGTETFMLCLGAMPLPSNLRGLRNLEEAMQKRLDAGHCIVIFPEAHIWPYYTKIRPFRSVSFKYPVKWKKPTYCFTVTYQERKFTKRPKMVIYVDGPFYPNETLHPRKQQEELRDRVYETMCMRAKNSNVEYVHYIDGSAKGEELA